MFIFEKSIISFRREMLKILEYRPPVPGYLGIVLVGCLCCIHASAGTPQSCGTPDQNIPYIADNLLISYEVMENFDDYTSSIRLNLTNSGFGSIDPGNWEIYFSHMHGTLNSNSIPAAVGLAASHVNGVLHKLQPTEAFVSIGQGQTLVVPLTSSGATVVRSDVMPNWFVVTQGCEDARVIKSTEGESLWFVASFDSSKKWKRNSNDLYDPYSPEDRFKVDYVTDGGGVGNEPIPRPYSTNLDPGETVDVRSGQWVVIIPNDDSLRFHAQYLADYLDLELIPSSGLSSKFAIRLTIDPSTTSTAGPLTGNQANHRLVIAGQPTPYITVTGFNGAGVFYGIQTLLSFSDARDGKVPVGTINDGPRFDYRGMMLDVSRNFHTTDDLRRLIDVMSTYKMNNLHLHLGDDEGWRLEIPEIPELTEVGSNRCHDLTGDRCLISQLGSLPGLPNLGSGYYSTSEYRSILDYANKRHIRVIPEFDMPGHAHAPINAMLARYRKYNSTDPVKATEFLLSDFEDESNYLSIQAFTDNAINPCVQSTYKFIETVLRSVQRMHEDIQPLTLFHAGGDEVPRNAWLGSPACKNIFGPGVTQDNVKEYFVTRVSNITKNANVGQVLWEDGIYDGNFINEVTYANAWNNVWEWGGGGRAYELANQGYKVILSHATHLYFDFPYEADPEERGSYWATREDPMKKVFSFIPDTIYDNIEMGVDHMGAPLDRATVCANNGCPDLTEKQNIVGMQGQLWSEMVRTSPHVDFMLYPRILALAERSWHKSSWESEPDLDTRKAQLNADWEKFANSVGYNEFQRLERLGVKYRIPAPGVSVDIPTGEISVTSGFPGQEVRYSTDLNQEWIPVPQGKFSPGPFDGVMHFATWSTDGRRKSRVVSQHISIPDGKVKISNRKLP